MISRLTFEEKFRPCFEFVFGRSVVCKSLKLASDVVQQYHGVDAITIDGNRVFSDGHLHGGFMEGRQTRLRFIKEMEHFGKLRNGVENTLNVSRLRLEELNVCVEDSKAERSRMVEQMTVCKSSLLELPQKIAQCIHTSHELDVVSSSLSQKQQLLQRNIEETKERFHVLNELLSHDFESDSVEHIQMEYGNVRRRVQAIEKKIGSLEHQRDDVELKIREIQIVLEDDLYVRRIELLDESVQQQQHLGGMSVEEIEKGLNDVNRQKGDTETSVQAIRKEIDELTIRVESSEKEKMVCQQEIDASKKVGEDRTFHRVSIEEKRSDFVRRLDDIGSVPQQIIDECSLLDKDVVMGQFYRLRERNKSFQSVNKKAVTQLSALRREYNELLNRMKALESQATALNATIQTLDERKGDDLNSLLTRLAINFESIFCEIVPQGEAKLVIKKDMNQKCSGVGMQVSFQKGVMAAPIMSLSGGQKTVASLALIFAVQREDPAPFYVFDEIDAALDDVYRDSIASLIHKISHGSGKAIQFIVTTFHSELISVCDACFGVTFSSNVSTVKQIEIDEALMFVDQERSTDEPIDEVDD